MNIAIIKVKNEMKKCMQLDNFIIDINSDNILEWRVQVSPQTNIFKGNYDFLISFPSNYPFAEPKIKFISTMFHPNIDRKGNICLAQWKSKYTIVTMLNSILNMFQEPNIEDPLNIKAANAWHNPKLYKELMNINLNNKN